MSFQTREYNDATDRGFLFSTWLRGLYYGNSYFGSIDKTTYFARYEKVLEHILAKPETRITILGLAGDDDTILGYIVTTGTVIHWCHVKSAWRQQGIARQLLSGMQPTAVTHVTPAGNAIRLKLSLPHNPFLI